MQNRLQHAAADSQSLITGSVAVLHLAARIDVPSLHTLVNRGTVRQDAPQNAVQGAGHGGAVYCGCHIPLFHLGADVQELAEHPVRRRPQHPLPGKAADESGDAGVGQGAAIPNTGIPGLIGGFAGERVLRAPADGVFHQLLDIGAQVKMGDVAATVDGEPMVCTLDGVLRGILADGTPVYKGMKAGDIDPRCELRHCYCASDKALAVGGGVLEAILHFTGTLEEASVPADGELYGAVQNELTEGKSLAALAMLIEGGRELEFTFQSGTYFLSRHGSARGVSLWHEQEEQAFSSVWGLLSGARLEGVPFREAWASCAIVTLF